MTFQSLKDNFPNSLYGFQIAKFMCRGALGHARVAVEGGQTTDGTRQLVATQKFVLAKRTIEALGPLKFLGCPSALGSRQAFIAVQRR